MPIPNGSASKAGYSDPKAAFHAKLVENMRDVTGTYIAGQPVLNIPGFTGNPEYADALASMIADGEEPVPVIVEGFVNLVDTLDTPGSLAVPPAIDPTYLVPLEVFQNLLLDIGIGDPIAWILENLPGVLDIGADPFIKAIGECDPSDLAEAMNKVDPNLAVDAISDAASALCGLEIPGLPEFSLPSFSFDLSFMLGDFALDLDIDQLNIFINFPQINFDFPPMPVITLDIIVEFVSGLMSLFTKIPEIIQVIPEGISAIIAWIAETVLAPIVSFWENVIVPKFEAAILMLIAIATYIKSVFELIAAYIIASAIFPGLVLTSVVGAI